MLNNCIRNGRTLSCGPNAQQNVNGQRCQAEALSAGNVTSLLLDGLSIIPGGGDLADVGRVGAATVTTVIGALSGDGWGISASLAGGSTAIGSLNRGSLSTAAGEAIPFVGSAVGLYAAGHDINNIRTDYNKCMPGGESA